MTERCWVNADFLKSMSQRRIRPRTIALLSKVDAGEIPCNRDIADDRTPGLLEALLK